MSRTFDFGTVDPFNQPCKYLETELRHRHHRKSQFFSDESKGIQRVHFYLRDKMRLVLNGEHPSDFLVRDPSWHMEHVNVDGMLDGVSTLHYDGGYTPKEATNGYLILWASVAPTEVYSVSTGTWLELQPFQMLAIHNQDFMHRTPWLDPESVSTRWFAKAFIYDKEPLYSILEERVSASV